LDAVKRMDKAGLGILVDKATDEPGVESGDCWELGAEVKRNYNCCAPQSALKRQDEATVLDSMKAEVVDLA